MFVFILQCEQCGREVDPVDPETRLGGKCPGPGYYRHVYVNKQITIPDTIPDGLATGEG